MSVFVLRCFTLNFVKCFRTVFFAERRRAPAFGLVISYQRADFNLFIYCSFCFPFIYLSIMTPQTQDVNWTYTRRSENVQNVFWTSYVRSIYVQCLRGRRLSNYILIIFLPFSTSHVYRSIHLEVFYEKGVIKNFAKFRGKSLCRSLCKFIKKDSDTGAFLLIWRNF